MKIPSFIYRFSKNGGIMSNKIQRKLMKIAPVTWIQSQNYGHPPGQEMWTRRKSYFDAKYGGRHTVTMLPGHGIGPEMMAYVKEVFKHAGAPVDFEEIALDATSEDMEELHMAITSIKRNGCAIKGNIETNVIDPTFISRNVELRHKLKLYAYLMHVRTYPGVKTRHGNLDIVLIRQNTEGEYTLLEHETVKVKGNIDITEWPMDESPEGGVVESLKICTEFRSEQLARFAFEFARKYNRKKVTAVHKANIMKLSDGLFLNQCAEVSRDYPEIRFDNMIIDNCCMQLVHDPRQFDVMVTSNLYGNILGNLICGLVGGAGLFSGRNLGDRYAVFEPGTRHTALEIVGKNVANPIAMLNAGADLLEFLKLHFHALILRNAIARTLSEDRIHTRDLGGQATSLDVVQNIISDIESKTEQWYPPQRLLEMNLEAKRITDAELASN